MEEQLPEFNRDFNRELEIGSSDNSNADIRPDIVIHERGTHKNNVFVAEIKKKHADIGKSDAGKVLCLTNPELDVRYNYEWGSVIPLDRGYLSEKGLFWIENCIVQDRKRVDFE